MLKFAAILVLALTVSSLTAVAVSTVKKSPASTPTQGTGASNGIQNVQGQTGTNEVGKIKPNTPQPHTVDPSTGTDESRQQASANLKIQEMLAIFTGLLVVVGFLQVGAMILQGRLMYRTLGTIKRQVDSMENAERARIVIEISRLGSFSLIFNAKNIGKTNANIIGISAFCEFLNKGKELPDIPQYEGEKPKESYMSRWVGSGEVIELQDYGNKNSLPPLIANLGDQVTRNNIFLYGHSISVYGQIRYLDGISPEERDTRFCYRIGVDKDNNTWAYESGPSAYIKFT